MDNKKKILVGVVFVILFILLVFVMRMILFSSDEKNKKEIEFGITIPKVDEKKIENRSKKENYDKENTDSISIDIGGVLDISKDKERDIYNPFGSKKFDSKNEKNSNEEESEIERLERKLTNSSIAEEKQKTKELDEYREDKSEAYEELKLIMELQKQIQSMSEKEKYSPDIPTIDKQLDIDKLTQSIQNEVTKVTNNAKDTDVGGTFNDMKKGKQNKNFFHGVLGNDDEKLELVPAETVDKGLLVEESIIAIRLKKELKLKEPVLTIPKNAIVYGKVKFQGTYRLAIDIHSYKTNEELYLLDLTVFDFDGRKGIQLKNRSWANIPATVAEDTYDYAYKKGTKVAPFGENNDIRADELEKIALLSATKEIANEIFKKRRIYLPRKYQLWINIKSE